MADVGAIRQNVQDMLAGELGKSLTIKLVPGLLEGPNQWSAEEWIGSVSLARVQENAANVSELDVYLLARFFAPFSSQGTISPNEPYDPAKLEAMAVLVQQAVARNQTGLGAWYQRVTQIEFDNETQGIQATIFARTDNDGVGRA